MNPSTHHEYLLHLSTQCLIQAENPCFGEQLSTYVEDLSILLELSLDPVRDALAALYCPAGQGQPTDPYALLRSWLLMTLEREGSPTAWARRLRQELPPGPPSRLHAGPDALCHFPHQFSETPLLWPMKSK